MYNIFVKKDTRRERERERERTCVRGNGLIFFRFDSTIDQGTSERKEREREREREKDVLFEYEYTKSKNAMDVRCFYSDWMLESTMWRENGREDSIVDDPKTIESRKKKTRDVRSVGTGKL